MKGFKIKNRKMKAKHVEIVGYFDQFTPSQMRVIRELPEYQSYIDAQKKLSFLVSHAIFEQSSLSDETLLEWNRQVVAKGNALREAVRNIPLSPLHFK